MKNTSKSALYKVQRMFCRYSDFIEVVGVLFLCIFSHCVIVVYIQTTEQNVEYYRTWRRECILSEIKWFWTLWTNSPWDSCVQDLVCWRLAIFLVFLRINIHMECHFYQNTSNINALIRSLSIYKIHIYMHIYIYMYMYIHTHS